MFKSLGIDLTFNANVDSLMLKQGQWVRRLPLPNLADLFA
jgi:hypothetical protein